MPVYPRWRGEHVYIQRGKLRRHGLSPLARGTLLFRSGNHPRRRFIPAGAGNTDEESERFTEKCGLSPLARGTLVFALQ